MFSLSHWGMFGEEALPIVDSLEEQIILTARGNCRALHTFEEWQNCSACKIPQSLIPYWRNEAWA